MWKNLQQSREQAVLTYAWLSQEIQESGQLRSVPISLPTLHFFTTVLLLHRMAGTEDSETQILTNLFRIPLYNRIWPGLQLGRACLNRKRQGLKKDQKTQTSNVLGSIKSKMCKKVTVKAANLFLIPLPVPGHYCMFTTGIQLLPSSFLSQRRTAEARSNTHLLGLRRAPKEASQPS